MLPTEVSNGKMNTKGVLFTEANTINKNKKLREREGEGCVVCGSSF